MASFNDQIEVGLFLPTTGIFDPQLIYELDIKSKEFKEFLVILQQSINNMSQVVNQKDSGIYTDNQFVNGQQFFPNPLLTPESTSLEYRSVFRTTVNFGVLPNTGLKSVAHNIPDINTNFSFTRIYATATKPTVSFSYIPIPYVSLSAENIEISVDATNVNITTESDRSSYTICYVVLEYIKS